MVYRYESRSVELKEILSKKAKFRSRNTICAMANSGGGKIVIGVKDDGRVVGVKEGEIDRIQRDLEDMAQGISPVLLHKIIVEKTENKKLVVMEIYRVEGFCTVNGVVYYRFGSQDRRLEGKTLQDFLIHRQIISFDTSKSRATLKDLDMDKIISYLKKRSPGVEINRKNINEYLQNLNLIRKNGTLWVTNTCALFFAKDVSVFVPQSEIKVVLFRGLEPIEIVDSRFVKGSPLQLYNEAFQFVWKYVPKRIKITAGERKEIPLVPEMVLRESIINALVHRDYFNMNASQINLFDDRIEVINPGRLPEGVSLSLLGTVSIQRNPLTYMIMRDLGYVEGLGTGIPRMREELRKAGLPEPVFQELGNLFKVVIYMKKGYGKLAKNEFWIINFLKHNPVMTSKQAVKTLGISKPTAVKLLNGLVKKGFIKKIGKTKGAHYIIR